MPAPIIKEGWAEALEPGIRAWFEMGRGDVRMDPIMGLYNVQSSSKSSEHVHTFGGVDPDSWDEFNKSGKIPAVSVDEGYKTSFENVTYMVELPVKVEWIEDEQYNLIQNLTMGLARAAERKRILDSVSLFNNAFSASFLGADGKALCADDHPLGPNSSATGDNNYALALSKTNLETIRQNGVAIKDDKGNNAGIVYDTLIVPTALQETAFEITQSPFDPDSAENARNFQQEYGWSVVVSHYLSDSNAWFVADSVAMRSSLHWFNRVPLSIYLKNTDRSVFATYVARMRYDFGWSDWRFIAGSNPS